jgi:hypothetical protein
MDNFIEARRRFMAHFTAIGLGTTLIPGIIWARMQDAGEEQIVLEMVRDAMKLSGLELTEEHSKIIEKHLLVVHIEAKCAKK